MIFVLDFLSTKFDLICSRRNPFNLHGSKIRIMLYHFLIHLRASCRVFRELKTSMCLLNRLLNMTFEAISTLSVTSTVCQCVTIFELPIFNRPAYPLRPTGDALYQLFFSTKRLHEDSFYILQSRYDGSLLKSRYAP